MTLQPFAGVDTFPTHHCITGSLRRVYEANGVAISEEMLLGLGSGVGFAYFHFKGTDPFYGGRGNFERPGVEGLEKTVGHRTGVQVESHVTGSRRKAEAALNDMLEAGETVMVYLDMGFLPYLGLPDDYHFGAHCVAVVGYDAATGSVLVGDRDDVFHELTLDVLEQARGSKHKPFPPQHKWYTFEFGAAHDPRPEDIWESIRDVTTFMLEPPITNFGVKGIRKAAKQTVKWPDLLDDEALRRTCYTTSIFIDATGGTGGGIFRYMYGRYLAEAAEITGEQRLEKIGDEFRFVGDSWEEVATSFQAASEASDPGGMLPCVVAPMFDIADDEETLWKELARLGET